ncbi:uncharacterized protein LOC119628945 [Bombyx mori]|uniref:DDE-1 domain-containing protein n=1 Tax=Bombyx mori TaxID=7091 RepID=A0A8R2LY16_BOMMO|nr:uncharacterized protein LOC119628648 [Bombyx mori]XP_037869003.1 uncharacterized protein LOC119628945 [Bombyx mori]
MPRIYKADPRGKRYNKYDVSLISEAVEAYRSGNKSLKFIADKFKIDKSVLYRHATRTMKRHGGQTVLSEETEETIIKYINICADWGYPLDSLDLRFLVKYYLDKVGRTVLKFKNNLPGPDFVRSFLRRHKDQISQRNCQNIKNNRAAVSPMSLKKYFEELKLSLENVEPQNIINYDETNLTDDPGRKKIITKRGTKYPERVVNHSKSSISIMMSATAEGDLLPPYVVYKAQNLYDTWCENGPAGTRYNRSQSGWFDGNIFEDWVKSIVLPYFRNKEGKKVLIGDNLSSHLSLDVIKLCHEQDISFIFLPANSTHLTQPLDVAFFRPMKMAWRNILVKWKKTDGKSQTSLPKGCFPKLLKKLMEDLSENAKQNIISGFRKTGIKPIDPNQVLSRLPEELDVKESGENEVEKSVLDILKEMRYGTTNINEPKRKRKLEVIPGRSVGSSEDYGKTEEESENVKEKAKRIGKRTKKINNEERIYDEETAYYDEMDKKVYKGKGKGKKTKRNKGKENEEKKEIVYQKKTDDANSLNNIQYTEIDCLSNEDIEAMSITIGDYVLYEGNEIVIAENFTSTSTEGKENLTPRIKKISTNNKVNILADEIISPSTSDRKISVHLNEWRQISPHSFVKTANQPSTSGSKSTMVPAPRSSYYTKDADILKDLMDDDII